MSNVISFPEVSTVANDSRVPNTGFDLERKLRSVTRLTDLLGAGYQHLFQGGTEPVSDIAELKMQAVSGKYAVIVTQGTDEKAAVIEHLARHSGLAVLLRIQEPIKTDSGFTMFPATTELCGQGPVREISGYQRLSGATVISDPATYSQERHPLLQVLDNVRYDLSCQSAMHSGAAPILVVDTNAEGIGVEQSLQYLKNEMSKIDVIRRRSSEESFPVVYVVSESEYRGLSTLGRDELPRHLGSHLINTKW